MTMNSICVFCGSGSGAQPVYGRTAVALADEMGRRGLSLVYGGGRVGLMGTLADAALAAGVRVTGVIPRRLQQLEVGHDGLDELLVVDSMTERKALMAERADGFVSLPGGLGTLDEMFEMLTWTQLGLHAKPSGLLNPAGYFDPLLAFLEHAGREGFVQGGHPPPLLTAPTPAGLLDALAAWRPAPLDKAAWALNQLASNRRHP